MGVDKIRNPDAEAFGFPSRNMYYETLKTSIEKREKEGLKRHDKNTK